MSTSAVSTNATTTTTTTITLTNLDENNEPSSPSLPKLVVVKSSPPAQSSKPDMKLPITSGGVTLITNGVSGKELSTTSSSGDTPPSSSAAESTTTVVIVNGTSNSSGELPRVITEENSRSIELGPNLQKVVLEDIKLDEYYNDSLEESMCKQFKFHITNYELKSMIDNSVLETSTAKPYRYLTGNFIKIFERHVELFEKQRIPIQKRNNIVYEESLRNNTVYLRVNGDCKLCPKTNRVKYVFTIKNKPEPEDKLVDVEGKIRGCHQHNLAAAAAGATTTGVDFGALSQHQHQQLNGSHLSSSPSPAHNRPRPQKISLGSLNGTPVNASSNNNHNNSSGSLLDSSQLLNSSSNDKLVYVTKKRKINNSDFISSATFDTNNILNISASNYAASSSSSPPNSSNNNNTSPGYSANSSSNRNQLLNLTDKNVVNQIVNQITGKVMIKLDQINLKVNQISDRLYDLERKLDCVEVAEIQF